MPPVRTKPRHVQRYSSISEFYIKGRCLFDKLPIEILQQIGLELHQNDDLLHYASICKSTFDALERDDKHFWRCRFLKSFNTPDWPVEPDTRRANALFKSQFQSRQALLCDNAIGGFVSGHHEDEVKTLKLIRTLFMEADAGQWNLPMNTEAVIRFVDRLRSFEMFFYNNETALYKGSQFRPPLDEACLYWHPGLLMVQCMLAPYYLSSASRWKVLQFHASQSVVYSSRSARPLLNHGMVNFGTILHHINFWTCHLLKDKSSPIAPWYAELALQERPSFWSLKLSHNDVELNKFWKGTYAYLAEDELFNHGWRDISQLDVFFQDEFLGEGMTSPFQNMELSILEDGQEHYWPDEFKYHIPSTITRVQPRTRAQGQAIQNNPVDIDPLPVSGKGIDQDEEFFLSGWLEQLPLQMRMPGWRRLTMMKYYVDVDTGLLDDEGLWAYEGVMFPGSKIIVGRWWYPSHGISPDFVCRGPFIFWAVNPLLTEGVTD